MIIVHCPIVGPVKRLSTYVILVIGDVPSSAFVMNATPKALMNSETINSRYLLKARVLILFVFACKNIALMLCPLNKLRLMLVKNETISKFVVMCVS